MSDLSKFQGLSLSTVIAFLVDYARQGDDVDAHIGSPSYAGVTARSGQFAPDININDARQRWLFRMVHSTRPLQEKMTLFWHQHFSTGYTKIANAVGGVQATKMLALVDGNFPGPPGQIELLRARALGKFRDVLTDMAKCPAMSVWLDGRVNTKAKPQENFGREIMEVFSVGVGNYAESDVYAAARVFTGWNMCINAGGSADEPNSYFEFIFNPDDHETSSKTFTFPVYPDGSRTLKPRSAGDGMQEGLDLIAALARHPETARRLARQLWTFFVSELEAPPEDFVSEVAQVYLRSDTEMRPVLDYILRSPWFADPRSQYARYAWPVEFVARAIKETGWEGFSLDSARAALPEMGQMLFEPPDVNGWELGPGWISTGTMLARMNFAATLAANQKVNLAQAVPEATRSSGDALVTYMLERFSPMGYSDAARAALVAYAGGTGTGSSDVAARVAGLARLLMGSAEYQFV